MNNLSPTKHRLRVIGTNLFAFIFSRQNLSREAFDCYRHKLPRSIMVSWKREDDGYIVGEVTAEGCNFMTQGKNAKDFIEMVNDAVYAVYEIPPRYIPKLGGYNRLVPKKEGLEKLRDRSISVAKFGFRAEDFAPIPC